MDLRTGFRILLGCVVLAAGGTAQVTPTSPACPPLTADEIVTRLAQRNLERAEALPAYRSTRTYRTQYRGFPGSRSAEMVVDVTFEPPGTKTFTVRSQTGSKLIIDRVFKKLLESEKEAADPENQKRTALNGDNYAFTLTGCDAGGRPAFVLEVEPKVKSKFLYRGTIWVDAGDFAVTRISAEPAKNPSFWIKHTQIEHAYVKVNDFWLPATNRSATKVRLGGQAELFIEYGEYRLNGPATATGQENRTARR